MPDRAYLIKMISIAKSQLKIDEEDWRNQILPRFGAKILEGKVSIKTLTDTALERLYLELKSKGFQVKRLSGESMAGWRWPRIKLIYSLWHELKAMGIINDPSDKACETFCKKFTNVDRLQFADNEGLGKCVEVLKKMKAQRVARSPNRANPSTRA